jgi:isocitrate dehydrogenase (NAD+)
VHCIQKSNIMKFTDGLFLSTFREVAKEFPDIEPWENLVDATCMGLVQRPEEWDVLVLPNLYGDILSDLTAGMVGGLGVAPAPTSAPPRRCSRRRTARPRSTRARTRSTRPR